MRFRPNAGALACAAFIGGASSMFIEMKRIIWLGDSTVTYNKISTYPQTGLSQGLLWYLKDDVFLRSFAINGRSTKSFIEQGRLDEADSYIEADDLVFITFAHNDEKKEDTLRYTDPDTAFKENLKRMIAVAKKHGAYPVLFTPDCPPPFRCGRKLFAGKPRCLSGKDSGSRSGRGSSPCGSDGCDGKLPDIRRRLRFATSICISQGQFPSANAGSRHLRRIHS